MEVNNNECKTKKAFKKKYGYNPSNMKKYAKMVKRFVKSALQLVSDYYNLIKKFPISSLSNAIKEIQEMPEKEFNKKIENFSLREKEIALNIRTKNSSIN